jgi:hypothetical protein
MVTNPTRQTLDTASFSFMIGDGILLLPLYHDTAENRTDLSTLMLFVEKYHIYCALERSFLILILFHTSHILETIGYFPDVRLILVDGERIIQLSTYVPQEEEPEGGCRPVEEGEAY